MTVDQLFWVIFFTAVIAGAGAWAMAWKRRWFEAGVLIVLSAVSILVVMGPST